MKSLVIGDVHAVPDELADCKALAGYVLDVVGKEKPDLVTFLGDQHNNHDAVSLRVVEFWKDLFGQIDKCVALVGNHDQTSPSQAKPHAMMMYESQVLVVDEPLVIAEGVLAMPYYFNPTDFMENAARFSGTCHTLICHQTIVGSKYETGFYAKDGVDVSSLGFGMVISGHIHSPQKFGNVIYPGSPRWRRVSDIGNRAIWLFEHTGDGTRILKHFPTDLVCKRIWVFEDSEAQPAVIDIPEDKRKLADIRVDIYGTPDYITRRSGQLMQCGVRWRGFPTAQRSSLIKESDGIDFAFSKFAANFNPPNGTDTKLLVDMASERISSL